MHPRRIWSISFDPTDAEWVDSLTAVLREAGTVYRAGSRGTGVCQGFCHRMNRK